MKVRHNDVSCLVGEKKRRKSGKRLVMNYFDASQPRLLDTYFSVGPAEKCPRALGVRSLPPFPFWGIWLVSFLSPYKIY